MAAAANYAWVNRSSMTFLTRQVSRVYAARTRACVGECGVVEMRKGPLQFRCHNPDYSTGPVLLFLLLSLQAFAKTFNSTPDDLDMHVIYDVSHNIAKVCE